MSEERLTPPPELVQNWMRVGHMDIAPFHLAQAFATQAANWGYQQAIKELEIFLEKQQ